MIISRTPFRVSLFGGGTDYPDWCDDHGGAVLAGAIDKYCYLTCRYLPPYFEHRMRIVYSKIETCDSVGEIQHPVVREVMRLLEIDCGIEIHHDGDLPGRSGMGTSSSFTVGLLNALYALQGTMPTRKQLAEESIHVERIMLNETVGSQDQILAAYGGFNHIEFAQGGGFSVRPVTVGPERLEVLARHLMLFYSGRKRLASDVASSYVSDLGSKSRQLWIMREMVDEALQILTSGGDLNQIGDLLHEAWQCKRSLGPGISTPELDAMYEAARGAGALGGKVVGAGGGGFMLCFVPLEHQHRVKEALHPLIHVPFQFCGEGSEIIFYNPALDHEFANVARLDRPSGYREDSSK